MGSEGRVKAISDHGFSKKGLGKTEENQWTASTVGEISRAVKLDVNTEINARLPR